MKQVDIGNCINELHFPITQAVPTDTKKTNFFMRLFNFIVYRRKFQVMKDYCLWVPSLTSWIFIPNRFIFDGASVPKILNNIFNPTGILLLGACPHDFGYRYKGLLHVDHRGCIRFVLYDKDELDDIFKHLCAYESGMSKASVVAAYTLRLFGLFGWKSNRKKNHILMDDFPELFVPEEVKDENV